MDILSTFRFYYKIVVRTKLEYYKLRLLSFIRSQSVCTTRPFTRLHVQIGALPRALPSPFAKLLFITSLRHSISVCTEPAELRQLYISMRQTALYSQSVQFLLCMYTGYLSFTEQTPMKHQITSN